MKVVRKDLEDGVKLPTDTYLKVFHSLHDPVASSTSSVLIYKGLKRVPSQYRCTVDGFWHSRFTRLNLRSDTTPLQKANQLDAFSQIAIKLK
jgi:carboxylesterase